MKRTYTDEQAIEAIKSSISVSQVLNKLNLSKTSGTHYEQINRIILTRGIDTSHFLGKAWAKNGRNDTYPLEDFLSNKRPIDSNKLKWKLIKHGLKKHICEICNNTEWNGNPIPIVLHHKDGNNKNNCIENLSIVCPNCHTFTDFYCVRKSWR